MLKNDFFTIVNQTVVEDKIRFTVRLDANHTIYKAHFPNNPITPGVCTVQMTKELFSFYQKDDFVIQKIKTVKFSNPIIPNNHAQIYIDMMIDELDEGGYVMKSTVCTDDIVFAKMNMQLKRGRL